MLEQFTVATFEPRVGSTFRVDGDGITLELELELVDTTLAAAGADHRSGRRAPFSIHFRGPREPLLEQRIYRFEHDQLGTFEIFIVPVARDEAGTIYEAVFA